MSILAISRPPEPLRTVAHPPGSKSHTIRALFVAAAAAGQSTLVGALDSEDTRHARGALRALGAQIAEDESTWTVEGVAGAFRAPAEPLNAGESGLTARFLMGLSPFLPGPIQITGEGRLPERPMGALLDNLRTRGAEAGREHPWAIDASSAGRDGALVVDASASSQVLSSLLLAAPLAAGTTTITAFGAASTHYVEVTLDVMRAFGAIIEGEDDTYRVSPGGYRPAIYRVPVDASSAAYPAVAAAITGGRIEIIGDMGKHPDRRIFDTLALMGCTVDVTPRGVVIAGPAELDPVDVDMSSAPDAAVALTVCCAMASDTSRIHGLHSLRLKESDRIAALTTELTKFGTSVEEEGDSLTITPGEPRPARFETHNDHRIAMSLALLGLVADGVSLEDPEVVSKTWPGYWEWLASTGAEIVEL
ncbi:MAG: 3-phosphoshikimate 1-carboxyvinyltransferase [Actinobacteria bacterium]|nr:MAG: 3-phosphoshikimate 1-carboxyvinyltransferase [Actinomycetota bacterium]